MSGPRMCIPGKGRPALASALALAMICAGAGVAPGTGPQAKAPLPDGATIQRLVHGTMLEFAAAVKSGDFSSFYGGLADLFRAQFTQKQLVQQFRGFLEQKVDLTVLEGHEPTFTQPPFLDGNGWLVADGSYQVFPHHVDFNLKYLYERGAWKLVGINVQLAPLPAPAAGPVPETAELLGMVRRSIHDFALAVNARDFHEFHARSARRFQSQFTPGELAETFKDFSDRNIDLTFLEAFEPELTEKPFLDEDGLLVVRGMYEIAPYAVPFELKYIFEETGWMLFGINLNVTPFSESGPAAAAMPNAEETIALASDTMLSFAVAVKAADFTAFYERISDLWKHETSPEELQAFFSQFVEASIDLTTIEGMKPAFDGAPRLDEDGVLEIVGTYPTQPSTTHFTLRYVAEGGSWGLIGINVQLR